MRKTLLASTAIALTFFSPTVSAQSEPGKLELGGFFTSITKPDSFGSRVPDTSGSTTEAGFGGRFTFNFNRNVAVEAEGNFFPHNCRGCDLNAGKLTQGLFGVKAGKRFRNFGLFAKARPGFASFSDGEFQIIVRTQPPGTFPVILVDQSRATNFAFDLGGVVEVYHSRRLFTRFDAGDTMIRYGERTLTGFSFDPLTGTVSPFPFIRPRETRHNFQFSAGIGFRF